MSLVEYAKAELDRIKKDKDGMQELINKDILDIIEVFAKQDHSGFSAGYTTQMVERLMRYKPITPLTGEPNEWEKGSGQNKRCSSVFKYGDIAYDNDAIIVSDNGGITWFTSGRFRKQITFPYIPPTKPEKVYIEYKKDVAPGYTSDDYEIITNQPERIKSLYERKRAEFDALESEE